MAKNEKAIICEGCGKGLPGPNTGYGWRSVLVRAVCGPTTLCSACWIRWGQPLRGWARRWVAGGLILGIGLAVVYGGEAAGGSGVATFGIALLLLGLAVRPSYRRPPLPPRPATGPTDRQASP